MITLPPWVYLPLLHDNFYSSANRNVRMPRIIHLTATWSTCVTQPTRIALAQAEDAVRIKWTAPKALAASVVAATEVMNYK